MEREPELYGVLADKKPPAGAMYADLKLACENAESIRKNYEAWLKYKDDIKNHKPVKRYNWK